MTSMQPPAPDLAVVKARQQVAWTSGDYHAVATLIVSMAEQLVQAADLPAGARVLDVAAGSGNASLAAARCATEVTALDYVPALLERGRVRADAEGLTVEWVEGDAEALPYPDASFDAVISCVGVMFAPDQERTAAELLRVCRPGGTIALANWTPASFVGGIFRTVGAHVPPPPGMRSPALWGTRERVAELFGDGVADLRATEREFVFRFRTATDLVDFFRVNYGPIHKAFGALDEAGRTQLQADFTALTTGHARPGPTLAVPSTYLEVLATRR